jgi:hypothetical protein
MQGLYPASEEMSICRLKKSCVKAAKESDDKAGKV